MSEIELKKAAEVGYRVIFGWAVVSSINNGEPYVDTQGDWIPDEVALDAAVNYARGDRAAKVMHAGAVVGTVIFVFPLTAEIQAALELSSPKTGLAIGMQIEEGDAGDRVLAEIRSGELRGFSVGGGLARIRDASLD